MIVLNEEQSGYSHSVLKKKIKFFLKKEHE